MLESAQNTLQYIDTFISSPGKNLSSTADMRLYSHAAPRLSLSSDAYQIVIKTEERERALHSPSASEKTGSLFISIFITNELTSIPPLDSSLRLYFLMCSVSLSW